jgi:hypothetical protein
MLQSPVTALIVALAVTAPLAAQDAPPPPGGPGPGSPAGRDGAPPREGGPRGGRGQQGAPANLEASMKAMNRSVKALKGLLSDPAKKDEALKTVSEAQRACAACKAAPLPQKFTARAPDAEAKAKIEAEFRGDLRKNLRLLLDLEDAILAGKADEATAILAKVEGLRDHAHEELGVD